MASNCRRLSAIPVLAAALLCGVGAQAASAQSVPIPEQGNSWLSVTFPKDSPVLIVSSGLGSTTAHVKGSSIALEIHTSLLLRNTGTKPINGLTLRVDAEDLTPAARGSVTVPSLHAEPGDVFPVRIDMELVRPFSVQKSDSPLVQISLDCALFDDLTAYGPDKLGSKRALTVYELEARRDRKYLANLLNTGRIAELRKELGFGLEDFSLPQLAMELLRRPGSDASSAASADRGQKTTAVDVLTVADSPVEAVRAAARVTGDELRAPAVQVKNRSQRPVRSIEMGWVLKDDAGRDFVAASVPAKISLSPIETARMAGTGDVRFLQHSGRPLSIEEVLAFINNVEFGDGTLWIPSRVDIDKATSDPVLRRELVMSPEQERLASLYRRKGMEALSKDLRRVY